MMMQIHKRGIVYCFSEIDSIEASSLPSCFMHKFQIPNATTIASKRRPRVLQRFLTGVSIKTDIVFFPETFSTK